MGDEFTALNLIQPSPHQNAKLQLFDDLDLRQPFRKGCDRLKHFLLGRLHARSLQHSAWRPQRTTSFAFMLGWIVQ